MIERMEAETRMARMGFERYDLERRVFSVPAGASFEMDLWNVWLFVVMEDTAPSIRVDSNFGVLDLSGGHTMQQLEHTGRVIVTNTGTSPGLLVFLAAVPRNQNTKDNA